MPDGGRARSAAPDELVASVDDELPLDENVATDPEEAVGAAVVPVEGLGLVPVGGGDTVGGGTGGSGTVGTGTGGGGIVGVGTGSGTGTGGGGGGVGTGSETVGSETVIEGTPTSPSACAESTPAAAVAQKTARVRAKFVSRRTMTLRPKNRSRARTVTR